MICAPTIFTASTPPSSEPGCVAGRLAAERVQPLLFTIRRFALFDHICPLDISVSNACIAKGAHALAR